MSFPEHVINAMKEPLEGWRFIKADFVPPHAVVGGNHKGKTLYVGRLNHHAHALPAAIYPPVKNIPRRAYAAYKGKVFFSEDFDWMVSWKQDYMWIKIAGGTKYPNAVIGGETRGHIKFLVGRILSSTNEVPGRIEVVDKTCYAASALIEETSKFFFEKQPLPSQFVELLICTSGDQEYLAGPDPHEKNLKLLSDKLSDFDPEPQPEPGSSDQLSGHSQSQPGTSMQQSQPGTSMQESQPGTSMQESPPETSTQQSQPGTSMEESQPGTSMQESQPGTPMQESPPETSTQQSQPGTSMQESQPGTSMQESQPGTSTQQSQPGTSMQDSQPGTSMQEPQPGTSMQQPQPETSMQQSQPGTSTQQPQTGTSMEESQPGTSMQESPPGTSMQQSQPGTSTQQPQTGTSTQQPQTGTSMEESQPGTSMQEPQPGTSTQQPQTGTSTQQSQYEEYEVTPFQGLPLPPYPYCPLFQSSEFTCEVFPCDPWWELP